MTSSYTVITDHTEVIIGVSINKIKHNFIDIKLAFIWRTSISNCVMRVWECCKDNDAGKLGRAKFDCLPAPKFLANYH